MIETYERLAAEIIERAEASSASQLLIGIAGPPGAGKSTLSREVSARIPGSIVVPMDGYHFTKQQLSEFDNPEDAFSRRGAPWTFDAQNFVNALLQLKEHKYGTFPAFEHGVGDPVDQAINVTTENKVVLIEGNYLTLDVPPWDKITSILDWTYFIECDADVLENRLMGRCLAIGKDPDESKHRIHNNDIPNALICLASKDRANELVLSI